MIKEEDLVGDVRDGKETAASASPTTTFPLFVFFWVSQDCSPFPVIFWAFLAIYPFRTQRDAFVILVVWESCVSGPTYT